MNICVVGTGYVGLVTGAVFADLGNDVACVDNQREKVAALRAGQMPIYEPGLEEMVVRNVADGRLSFTDGSHAAVRRSDIVFITVGTPPGEGGETDLSAVESVAARHRPGHGALHGGREQVHGPRGHRGVRARGDRAPSAPAHPLRRGVQPRVPPRGLGHRGHPAARPHRHRRPLPAGGHDPARAVCARWSAP